MGSILTYTFFVFTCACALIAEFPFPEERVLAKNLTEAIADHLKYVDGLDDILGKFYYLSDPGELEQGIEHWLVHSSEGRAWLDKLGFINKEAVIKVIEQIETNLEESSRELVTKIQMLRSYVDSKGNADSDAAPV